MCQHWNWTPARAGCKRVRWAVAHQRSNKTLFDFEYKPHVEGAGAAAHFTETAREYCSHGLGWRQRRR
jgi:hypothetical protein